MSLKSETDAEQGTAEWRQHRAGSITGSGFAKLLTQSRDKKSESKTRQNYRLQLLTERVTGYPASEIDAPALTWGKDNEEAARLAYELQMAQQGERVFVERVGYQPHTTLDWVGTSPDGLVGEDGMIEIKCPFNSAVHLTTIIQSSSALAAALAMANDMEKVEIVPPEHMPQIQGNLWVLNRKWCDFISYDPRVPEHLQLYVARIERDEEYIKKLEVEVRKLLDEIEENVGKLLSPETISTVKE